MSFLKGHGELIKGDVVALPVRFIYSIIQKNKTPKNDSTFELVAALAKRLDIKFKSPKLGNSVWKRVSATFPTLVRVKRGSPKNGGGTWIHHKLAVPLAMWISPEFALLVSDWVEQWLMTGQNPINTATAKTTS